MLDHTTFAGGDDTETGGLDLGAEGSDVYCQYDPIVFLMQDPPGFCVDLTND